MNGEATQRPLLQVEQQILIDTNVLYALIQEQVGPATHVAPKLREMLQDAQHKVLSVRLSHLQAVKRVIAPHQHRGALWQLLRPLLVGGRPRKASPFSSLHAHQTMRDRAPPWAPWCVLAPPAVPQLIPRK